MTALLIDRFIPDDMEFTEEPRSVCTETPAAYNPSLFVSTALAQSKVSLILMKDKVQGHWNSSINQNMSEMKTDTFSLLLV